MIKIQELEKYFGDEQILKKINLEVKKGDIFGLVGKSGVGKSTLLRCINQLESYDSGSLRINGREVKELKNRDLREYRKNVGIIFQQFSLAERYTVYENIALPMKCWNYKPKQIKDKVEELLRVIGLEEKRDAKPRSLSGGQKQRVAIARALTLNPSILLCDEATSALDPNTTKAILQLLKKINQDLGVTIVIVTHEMSVVREICNRVAVLDKNGIADVGKVEDVFMNQCSALVELLGGTKKYSIDDEKQVVKIFYSSNKMEKNIISKMGIETGVAFEMLSANMQDYATGIFGEFDICLKREDKDKILDFLNRNHIIWEDIQ